METENKEIVINITADTAMFDEAVENVKNRLIELTEFCDEIGVHEVQPIFNFYGCSFNFGEGRAESGYYCGNNVTRRLIRS